MYIFGGNLEFSVSQRPSRANASFQLAKTKEKMSCDQENPGTLKSQD